MLRKQLKSGNKQVAEKYSDYRSFSMDAYAEGIKLAIAHNQGEIGDELCKKFATKFPNSKDGRIFDARLTIIINEIFPKEKNLDATQNKEAIAKQIANAREKTLTLLEDFKDMPFQKGAVSFLSLLKEVEDISEGRNSPKHNSSIEVLPTVTKSRVLFIIINIIIISIIVYRIFYYNKKNKKG
jgi:hypothetical protein